MKSILNFQHAGLLGNRGAMVVGLILVASAILVSGWQSEGITEEQRMQFILESPSQISINQDMSEVMVAEQAAETEAVPWVAQVEEDSNVASLYRRGRSLYLAGDYAGSVECFEEVVDVNPNYKNAKKYLDLARVQLEQSRKESAPEVEPTPEVEPAEVEVAPQSEEEPSPQNQPSEEQLKRQRVDQLMDQARDARRGGNYEMAIQLYDQVLEIDPGNERAIAYRENSKDELKQEIEQSRRERVDNEIDQGRALLRADRFEEAINQFDKVLEMDPGNQQAIEGKEEAAEQMRIAAERAEEEARRQAEREKQQKIRDLYSEGRRQLSDDQYEAAIGSFGEILELDPEHRGAQRYLARAEDEKKKAEEEALEQELGARYETVRALLDRGEYEQAIVAAKEIQREYPDNDRAGELLQQAQAAQEEQERQAIAAEMAQYVERARVYLEADQLDQAEEELVAVLERDPGNESAQQLMQEVAQRRTEIEAEQERLAAEAAAAEEAQRQEEAQQRFAKAKELYEAGQVIAAVEKWNEALEFVPDHQETLAYLEQTKGEYQAALTKLEEEKAEQERLAEIEDLLNQNVPLLDLKDTDIDNVISLLGTISGFNMVATEGVDGIITVNIRNKTVREALNLILRPNGFKYEVEGRDIIITTDFKTRIFPLTADQYDKIDVILEDPTSLEDPTQELRRLLYGEARISPVPGREIRLNPNTRSLIVTDTQQNIEKVEAFLENIPEYREGREPLITRHYKLDEDSAQQVFELIELTLYGELGRRSLGDDDPRLLILESETNIMIVKDTVERIQEVENILNNQALVDQLTDEELIAREFRISVEPEPPEGVSRTEWLYRREQEVNFVVDVLTQMLYGFGGQEEAIAKGRRIFRRNMYNLDEDGTITVVDSPENISRVEQYLSQTRGGGQTVVESIRVRHADINAMLNLLNLVTGRVRQTGTQEGGSMVSDTQIDQQLRLRLTLHADPASQTIIVRGNSQQRDQIEAVRDLVQQLDVPVPQVEIEARLVEIRVEDTRGLTFDYDFFELFEDRILLDDGANRTSTMNLISDAGQGFNLNLATFGNTRFNFAMNAIEQMSNAEILSAPKVTVVSDNEAQINIITNEPYIESVDVQTQGTDTSADDQLLFNYEQEEVGITMLVTPTVLGDKNVVMDVEPSITTIVDRLPVTAGADTGGFNVGAQRQLGQPVIAERSAVTRVKVKDGDTLVIGGLIRDELTSNVEKVPLLGDIPWLGTFFRDTSDVNIKSQLLIFMTVRILPEN
jgi:type II secretory pathway component GspD/PulD (secretin)